MWRRTKKMSKRCLCRSSIAASKFEQINQIYEHDRLNQLLEEAITIGSISDFQQQLSQENTDT